MRNPKYIVPMAGKGQRFVDAGYSVPKPFIDIEGKPMIRRVLDSLPAFSEKIVLAREDQRGYCEKHLPDYKKVYIEGDTGGAANTVLLADKHISNFDPIVIVDSDQILHIDHDHTLRNMEGYDGGIITFPANGDPKYSYVDGWPIVRRTAEKQPISDYAACGFYYFASWRLFREAAQMMVANEDKVNGEYYICPIYNYLKSFVRNIPIENGQCTRWGTPEEVEAYHASAKSA